MLYLYFETEKVYCLSSGCTYTDEPKGISGGAMCMTGAALLLLFLSTSSLGTSAEVTKYSFFLRSR
jgi:hypothetical protein